jgi:hypothetical protein
LNNIYKYRMVERKLYKCTGCKTENDLTLD